MPRILLVCVYGGLVAGCTGDTVDGVSSLAPLFDMPSGANPDAGGPGWYLGLDEARRFHGILDASSGPGSHTPKMALHFTATTLTNATQCAFTNGPVVYAGEVEPVQVDARSGTITVLPSNGGYGDDESYQVYECKSSLMPGTVHFSINGVSLSLTDGPYGNGTFVKTSD